MRAIAVALAALLLLPVAGSAKPARHVAVKDWTTVTAMAPSGGFVMGNPTAKVRLVEYASFTCPHCAHFSDTGMAALRAGYIRPGKVSLEVRTAVRDRVDLAAALLARCGGPSRFFATSELLFASQGQWLPKAMEFEGRQGAQLTGQPRAARLGAIARGAGLDALLRPRGIAPARIDACLASPSETKRVTAMTDEAWNVRRISGTPFFLVNGAATEARDWPSLEAALRAAL